MRERFVKRGNAWLLFRPERLVVVSPAFGAWVVEIFNRDGAVAFEAFEASLLTARWLGRTVVGEIAEA